MLLPYPATVLWTVLGAAAVAHAHDQSHYLARLRARHPHVSVRALEQRAPTTTTRGAKTTAAKTGATDDAGAAVNTVGVGAGGGAVDKVATAPVANSALLTAIGTTTLNEPTSPLPTTYAQGASVPIPGASGLPSAAIDPSQYPALDKVPPTTSAQVQQWLSEIDLSKVPTIAPTSLGGCSNASNAQAVAAASTNCWWTCGGCTRQTDITVCPTKNTWGSSYDDGPSPYTPQLLDYLDANSLKTTFFVVGSRAISRPQMLQYEVMDGHQISVHTWSHPPLTTLTNEQIVAELGWSRYAIKQITGLTPNTMRPPYGDIDDRVRSIATQMGLQPIIWTSANGRTFDSQDWQIAAGVVTAPTVLKNFESILASANGMSNGFVVLEHDLYQQSVDLATNFVLPYALQVQPALTIEPIINCLGKTMADAYVETASNSTSLATAGSTGTGTISSVQVAVVTQTGAAGATLSTPSTVAAAPAATKSAAGHSISLPSLALAFSVGALVALGA